MNALDVFAKERRRQQGQCERAIVDGPEDFDKVFDFVGTVPKLRRELRRFFPDLPAQKITEMLRNVARQKFPGFFKNRQHT
jgi:hypothetical protein